MMIPAATVAAVGAGWLGAGEAGGGRGTATDTRWVGVQLLALNDLHGHLEPHTAGTVEGRPAGGVEYLATHVRRLAADNPRTLVVAAGDLVGGSPLISASEDDRPTIEALNRIGLDATALGNHELDRGTARLREHVQDAEFPFLSANVIDTRAQRTLLAPSVVERVGGVRIGLIGATVAGTPTMVDPEEIEGLRFTDEAAAINRAARELRRRGVRAIAVLVHEGAAQDGEPNDCAGVRGPIVDIVRRTTRDVDLFITGHTHEPYRCEIDGRPVTSAGSYGRLVTDIDLRLDRRTGEVVGVRAFNELVTQDVSKAPDLTELVERYGALVAPVADRVIGALEAPASRTRTATGETRIGALIADAQLQATREAAAVAAFVNPGSVRSGLDAGAVTFGEAFASQPFERRLITTTLTGRVLQDALKAQWCGRPAATVLTPSASVTYAIDPAAASRITGSPCADATSPVTDLRIDGAPVEDGRSYRVTLAEELAQGRDRFTPFATGTGAQAGPSELEALQELLVGGVSPPTRARIAVRR